MKVLCNTGSLMSAVKEAEWVSRRRTHYETCVPPTNTNKSYMYDFLVNYSLQQKNRGIFEEIAFHVNTGSV